MEAFISGLPRSIKGNLTASKPQTLKEAINIAQRLMDQIIKHNSTQDTNDHKRKFDDKNTTDNNNYPNDRNNNYQNNHNNDYHQQQNKKQETFRTYTATNGVGHLTKNCINKRPVIGNNLRPVCVTCNACGEKDITQINAQKQTTEPQESILRDKFAFVHFRFSTLETTLENIQVRHKLVSLSLLLYLESHVA
nr:hypothetical protein [Tanacetum cinerariifolium]